MDPSIEESQLREISNRIREQLKIKTNLTFEVESMGLISAEETPPPSLFWKLCRNSGNAMVVILNPSPVILSPFASLRVNSLKNLMLRHHPERSEGSHWFLRSAQDKLRQKPQNDITTQSPKGEVNKGHLEAAP